MEKNKGGQPKSFKNGDELIELWQEFCDEIVNNEFKTVPTQTEFSKWLKIKYGKVDRKTIYNSLNKYFPAIKEQFEKIRADVIMQGGMLGKYQPTMSIFGLKNWCKWADRNENINNNKTDLKVDLSKMSTEELKNILNDEV